MRYYNFFILIIVFGACKNAPKEKPSFLRNQLHKESVNVGDKYCFEKIRDSLSKLGVLDPLDTSFNYYKILKEDVFDNKNIEKRGYLKAISHFYEYSVSVKSFILKCRNDEYLIIIGSPAGATGTGVDYLNYQCYSLTSENDIIEFASLSDTPFSIYLNDKKELCHIEIIDNYPRPADGREVDLDYYPVIVSVYENKRKIKEIEYSCYSLKLR